VRSASATFVSTSSAAGSRQPNSTREARERSARPFSRRGPAFPTTFVPRLQIRTRGHVQRSSFETAEYQRFFFVGGSTWSSKRRVATGRPRSGSRHRPLPIMILATSLPRTSSGSGALSREATARVVYLSPIDYERNAANPDAHRPAAVLAAVEDKHSLRCWQPV
jgi:hypothetical protein